MKIRIHLFHFAAAFMAFIFGVGLFAAWQNMNSSRKKNIEAVAAQRALQPEIAAIPSAIPVIPVFETTSSPDLNKNVEDGFDAAGLYFVLTNSSESNDLPKAFADFDEISLRTTDYKNASEENDYVGTPIPPEGYVFAKREYKFARINIGNRLIAFETESKSGISYKFVGKFIDNVQSNEEDYADLEGHLIKIRNGKKIAETKVRLVAGGC